MVSLPGLDPTWKGKLTSTSGTHPDSQGVLSSPQVPLISHFGSFAFLLLFSAWDTLSCLLMSKSFWDLELYLR